MLKRPILRMARKCNLVTRPVVLNHASQNPKHQWDQTTRPLKTNEGITTWKEDSKGCALRCQRVTVSQTEFASRGQSSFQDCTNKCVASSPLQHDVPVSTTPSVVIVNFGLFCIHFTQFSLYKTSRGQGRMRTRDGLSVCLQPGSLSHLLCKTCLD